VFAVARRRLLSATNADKSSAGRISKVTSLYAWVLQHQLDRVIQVPGFKHKYPAQLLFRLG
jgi:hypothetical protein